MEVQENYPTCHKDSFFGQILKDMCDSVACVGEIVPNLEIY